MAHFFRKYRLILWKNYLIRRRHWFITILEVVIPIITFLLIALLRGELPDFKVHTVENATIFAPITEMDLNCKEFSIIYSPDNEFTRSLIKKVNSTLWKTKTYPCDNEGEMEVQFLLLKEKSYTTNLFGVIFEEMATNVVQPNNFHYKIRPGERHWYTDGLTPISPGSGPMQISDIYNDYCFTTLQLALDKAFIQHSMNVVDDADFPYEFIFQKFPYPPYVQDSGIASIFNEILPSCTYASFLILFVQIVNRIVEEKASGAKELMCMMGMSKGIQWIGWLTTSLAVILVDLLFITMFLMYGFKGIPILISSNGFVIFLFLFLYCLSSILTCFVIAAFFSRESIAIIITIILMTLTAMLPSTIGEDKVGFCIKMLLSMFPNIGLHYGFQVIAILEGKRTGLQWNNFWLKPRSRLNELTMGNVFTMFMVEIVISGMVVWYLDRVRPGKYGIARPWYFPIMGVCSKLQSLTTKKHIYRGETEMLAQGRGIDQTYEGMTKGQFEALPPGKSAGIKIRGIRKVFGRAGFLGGEIKVAVDGVSLDILEGEITALLGHNGAGKTTLISILTGIHSASDGKVMMGGYNIEKEMDSVRENLGLCPQHSMLFPELTVWEHLIFFAMSKGCMFPEARCQARDMLNKFELDSKKNELATKLSGGMKRKLSLGMALIGNSKILILDEPTSGMDPESRRQLWDLLLSMRGQHTILLTTHYMEEADVLGDRIAIMDHGKVKCYGTSLFLKKAYGTGYHLTLLIGSDVTRRLDMQEIASEVTDLVKQSVPGALPGHCSGDELSFTLPTHSTESFPSLFIQLEQQGKSLGIAGLTLSVTTLEEVFLKVGKLDEDETKAEENRLNQEALDTSSSRSNQEALNTEKISGIHLVKQQVGALYVKKLLFAKAIWIQLLLQCAFGMVLILMSMKMTIPRISVETEAPLTFSISDYQNSYAFTSGDGRTGMQAEDIYMKLLSEKDTSVINVTWNEVSDALLEVGEKDEATYRDDYVVSATFEDSTVTTYFSTTLYHSCPTSLNLITTTLLRLLTNSNSSIVTTVHPFHGENFRSIVVDHAAKFVNAFIWTTLPADGLLIITSAFIMLPILEGESGARHLQLMTMSSSSSLFWIVSLSFDMAIYLVCILLSLLIFPVVSGGYTYGFDFNGSLFVMCLLFGCSSIPFTYFISYFKKTVGSGFSFYVNTSIFLGWIMGIVVIVMEGVLNLPSVTYILHIIGLFMPYFSLTLALKKFSFLTSYNSKCSSLPTSLKKQLCSLAGTSESFIDIRCCDNVCMQVGNCFKPISYFGWGSFSESDSFQKEEPEGMAIELLILALLCPFYIGILYLMDIGILSNAFEKLVEFLMTKFKRDSLSDELEGNTEDEDIFKEKDRVDFLVESQYKQEGKDTLVVHKLKKNYGVFRWLRGGQKAVRGISFGVDSGDCFGLLGANGAGKTSTFGMITGSHPPSSGASYVLGEKCRDWKGKNRKYEINIGYCPQVNATLGVLTGRQMLHLYACLRGVPKKTVDRVVQKWLDHMDLNEPADRPCKNYSGGNHRRLSAAIALMGERSLICLDEPTAGVDPVARRGMWDVLATARSNGAAILLTSHSMEECEALCTKLAIMVNGQFVCIGTVPYLKQKFGQGFTLLVKLNASVDPSDRSSPTVENLKDCIESKFDPCTIKDEHQGLLHYHIINPQTKWDFMFSTMEQLKRSHHPLIEDYSLSDTTLDFEVEDGIKTANILNSMESEHFSKLRQSFFGPSKALTDMKAIIREERVGFVSGASLSRTEFVLALEKILDWPGSGISAARLFDEIDMEKKEFITWENFLDHAIQWMGARETAKSQCILSSTAKFHGINHCKRAGAVAKIIPIKTETKISYTIVTVKGFVSLYDSNFAPMCDKTYHVPLRGFQDASSSNFGLIPSFASLRSSKIAKPWITDAILMEDTNVIVFAGSDRSLHFRDVGGRGSPWMFHVTGLRNVPTCLAYSPSHPLTSEKSSSNEPEKGSGHNGTENEKSEKSPSVAHGSILLFGDDRGNIWSLKFLRPNDSLFHRYRRKGEGAEHIHWLELESGMIAAQPLQQEFIRSNEKPKRKLIKQIKESSHGTYVEINVARNVHVSAVSQVSFRAGAPHAFVSCSSSDRFFYVKQNSKCDNKYGGASLVLQAESAQASPYIFKTPSGVRCFDLWEVKGNDNNNEGFMLVTGSCDALIRLWDPYVPQMAVATLIGHMNPIMDLMFIGQGMELLLISVCCIAEVRVWKINGSQGGTCCLQVVSLIFPAISPFGRKPEFGSKVLYIHQTRQMSLLVTYNSEIAVIPFEQNSHDDVSKNSDMCVRLGETSNKHKNRSGFDIDDSIDDLKINKIIVPTYTSDVENDLTETKDDSDQQERIFASALATSSKYLEHKKGKNECHSLQQRYQKEMKKYVSVCAPHLSLPIYPPAFVRSQPSVKRPTFVRISDEKNNRFS